MKADNLHEWMSVDSNTLVTNWLTVTVKSWTAFLPHEERTLRYFRGKKKLKIFIESST